jgi:hypothetical protein
MTGGFYGVSPRLSRDKQLAGIVALADLATKDSAKAVGRSSGIFFEIAGYGACIPP